MFKKEIFKAYDIRGEYGIDFDQEFVRKLGFALANYFDASKIVVSRDERTSSGKIVGSVIKGILSAGCGVVDIGITSTPLFYFGAIKEGSDAGIMVTASHLGEEFSGFKVTKGNAISVGGHELLKNIERLLGSKIEESKTSGNVIEKNLMQDYAEAVVKHSGLMSGETKTKVKLVGNEMTLNEARAVTNKLSIPVVENGEEITFEFDPDADRLIVHGQDGVKIRGDLIGGMLAGHYFEGKKVVYDLRYSRGVMEYMKSKKIEIIPSKIGHTLIKAVMREHDADFCGEQSGHIYFKEMGYVEVSLLAMLKILNLIKETGKNVNEMADSVSNWSTTEEINFSFSSREETNNLINKVKTKYSDANINEMDGVRAEYPDWGFLLRASNTEPKLRLIIDAKTEKLMLEKKDELVDVLRE